MDLNNYIKREGNIGFLKLKIIPNAKNTIIGGMMDDGALKIRIKSISENGKANIELINFVSKSLGLRKNNIEIVSGRQDRNKLLKIDL